VLARAGLLADGLAHTTGPVVALLNVSFPRGAVQMTPRPTL
jgi:hypothetical protein